MRVGVTGHRYLDDTSAWPWVTARLDAAMARLQRPVVAYSALASGTDQLFAEAVLRSGGALHAVMPFQRYELQFRTQQEQARYRALLAAARTCVILPEQPTLEQSYLHAGMWIVDHSELVITVWDGLPARGIGGTAEVLAYAVYRGRPVIHIDPVQRVSRPLAV
jgi:hypothetical protein